jgi:hypothetical protein
MNHHYESRDNVENLNTQIRGGTWLLRMERTKLPQDRTSSSFNGIEEQILFLNQDNTLWFLILSYYYSLRQIVGRSSVSSAC